MLEPPSPPSEEKLNNQEAAACMVQKQSSPEHPDNSINNFLEESIQDCGGACAAKPQVLSRPQNDSQLHSKNIYKPGRVKNVNEAKDSKLS